MFRAMIGTLTSLAIVAGTALPPVAAVALWKDKSEAPTWEGLS